MIILAEFNFYWQNITSTAEYNFHWQNMVYTD